MGKPVRIHDFGIEGLKGAVRQFTREVAWEKRGSTSPRILEDNKPSFINFRFDFLRKNLRVLWCLQVCDRPGQTR